MRRWPAVAASAALVMGGLTTDWSAPLGAILDVIAGGTFLAASVAASARSSRYGALAGLAGVAWFAGNVVNQALWLHRPLMLHTALAYPSGRVRSRRDTALLVLAWLPALVPPLARDERCSLLLAGAMVAVSRRDVATSAFRQRPAARVSAWAVGLLASSLALPAAGRLVGAADQAGWLLPMLYAGLVAAAGAVLVAGLVQQPGHETDTVIELTGADTHATLDSLRQETLRAGSPSAMSVRAAIDLLEANQALNAELAQRNDEVRASRRRLVEAVYVERQRLEQRLRQGALQYLDELAETLLKYTHADGGRAPALANQCLVEVDRTRDDLERLGQGLHPRALAEQGLPAALAGLADASPVPIEVRAPDQRFPPTVETTLWYFCAEAIANMGKHARAGSGKVEVWDNGPVVVAKVSDDGIGGARVDPDGGLAGLEDRIRAVSGTLRLASPPGEGTQIEVRVPWR
jgi:signal transduction histidine kinase